MRRNLQVSVNLTNNNEIVYYGPLKIGADVTTMMFNFDTGSDWLWVPLSKTTGAHTCPSCQTTKHHTIAAPDMSLSTPGSINYLDGSGVNGTIYNTTITIGNKPVTNMKVLMVTSWKDTSVTTST